MDAVEDERATSPRVQASPRPVEFSPDKGLAPPSTLHRLRSAEVSKSRHATTSHSASASPEPSLASEFGRTCPPGPMA